MGDSTPNIQVGRRVLFVGGPDAGVARKIPESYGDVVKHPDGEFVYRIHAFRVGNDVLHIAYENGNHILNAIVEMFREYSPTAQIKRETGQTLTYQHIDPNKPAP
jgi:hypothetical protein